EGNDSSASRDFAGVRDPRRYDLRAAAGKSTVVRLAENRRAARRVDSFPGPGARGDQAGAMFEPGSRLWRRRAVGPFECPLFIGHLRRSSTRFGLRKETVSDINRPQRE